jgi:cyclopropane-fatty-acyl-phospholipid synthase
MRLGCVDLLGRENYRVNATGITLSQNQYDYVSAKISELGLAGRVRCNCSTTSLPADAAYDKIASIGMFEHVGEHHSRAISARFIGLSSGG